MKQKLPSYLRIFLILLLLWFLLPEPFGWLFPQWKVPGAPPEGEQEIVASFAFSAEPDAVTTYYALRSEMKHYLFLGGPILRLTNETPQLVIHYFEEGGYAGGHISTTLLWDGHILWVQQVGPVYFGYIPILGGDFSKAMDRVVGAVERSPT